MTRFEAPARLRRRGVAAMALALVVALVSAGAPLSASADVVGTGPGTISGTVTETGGQPLEGIQVIASQTAGQSTVFHAYTFTDAAGHFEFSGVDAGTYDLSTYNSSYQNVPWQQATVSETVSTATVDFVFVPFEIGVGTISGLVTGDGVPLSGQFISVFNYATGQGAYASSDENGLYEFSGLPNGTWSFSSPSAPGLSLIHI